MKDIEADKVESFAAQGLTMEQIADCLGIATSTLYKRKKEVAEISEAIKRGRSKGIATITNALFQSAKGGNITAQIFYLKNRAPNDWKDRSVLDQTVDINVRQTVINAQPEQTTDEWIESQRLSGSLSLDHKQH